jgi:hypothetical protein
MVSNQWYTRHLRKELKILYTADKLFEMFMTLSFVCLSFTLFFQKYLLILLPSMCIISSNKHRIKYMKKIEDCIDTLSCFETHPDTDDLDLKQRARKILFAQ